MKDSIKVQFIIGERLGRETSPANEFPDLITKALEKDGIKVERICDWNDRHGFIFEIERKK